MILAKWLNILKNYYPNTFWKNKKAGIK